MRKILLRFDDICPTMDWDKWKTAVEIMDRYDIKPLIGVVPSCVDPELMIDEAAPEFWTYIKELEDKGYKVAMHGYQHLYDTDARGIVNNKFASEFAGHSYEDQVQKIKNGKQIFEENGLKVDVFFAPSHSYDMKTICALSDCNFKFMSDGKTTLPVKRNEVLCIPCLTGGMPKYIGNRHYMAVFHAHEWKTQNMVDKFESFCSRYKKDIVSFEDYLAGWRIGNVMIQNMYEFFRVSYDRYILPALVKIKHCLMR